MRGKLFALVCALVVLSAAVGSAAALDIKPSTLQTIKIPATIAVGQIAAVVDIKPESLQKQSLGDAVTGYIELPTGFDVRDITVPTVKLCRAATGCIAAYARPTEIGDYDHDSVPDLMVKFDRARVISLIQDVTPPASIAFTISGQVFASSFRRPFGGSAEVRILGPDIPPPTSTAGAGAPATPASTLLPTPLPTPTPAP